MTTISKPSYRHLLDADASPEELVIAYHERTKHFFHRYAASLGSMDWATQPDPFRRYPGADLVRLVLPKPGRPLPYWQLYALGDMSSEPLSAASISLFFRYALSLTAWKRFHETTWSLRANPSSGNLHPTEGYAVLPAMDGLGSAPAVYHYAPREHALERRAILDAKAWTQLCTPFPEGSFLVGLSSIHWREAWKYGERAFRYCQHDAGHALASLRIAAAALGWGLVLLDGISASAIADLLGLSRSDDYGTAEREEPELLALVTPHLPSTYVQLLNELRAGSIGAQWCGRANTLSPEHRVEWPVIDEVAQATRRSESAPITEDFSRFPTEEQLFGSPVRHGLLTAETAILGRRSAVAMDGSTDDLAGSVLPHARSVDTDARPAIDAMGCNSVAPANPSRPVRPPRRGHPARPLRARARSRQARGPQGSDAAGVSLAALALLSARAPAVPASGRGLSGARGHRLLRPAHRR